MKLECGMKKKAAIITILLVLLGSCLICVGFPLWANRDPYERKRANLAQELGVNLTNYPPRGFPINYFEEAIAPRMSSEEVHKIVRGYDAVFLCDTNRELYYFFSTDDNKADRYLVA